jgi:hypothetical protein
MGEVAMVLFCLGVLALALISTTDGTGGPPDAYA